VPAGAVSPIWVVAAAGHEVAVGRYPMVWSAGLSKCDGTTATFPVRLPEAGATAAPAGRGGAAGVGGGAANAGTPPGAATSNAATAVTVTTARQTRIDLARYSTMASPQSASTRSES